MYWGHHIQDSVSEISLQWCLSFEDGYIYINSMMFHFAVHIFSTCISFKLPFFGIFIHYCTSCSVLISNDRCGKHGSIYLGMWFLIEKLCCFGSKVSLDNATRKVGVRKKRLVLAKILFFRNVCWVFDIFGIRVVMDYHF